MKAVAAPVCFCGSTASLRSNSLLYNGREYGNGKAWICDRFPACRGSVGCTPEGRPLGTIPDQETKKLRIQVHAAIDPLWKNGRTDRPKKRNRASVYGWLRRIMEIPAEACHIGMFTKADCLKALAAIAANPYIINRNEKGLEDAKNTI